MVITASRRANAISARIDSLHWKLLDQTVPEYAIGLRIRLAMPEVRSALIAVRRDIASAHSTSPTPLDMNDFHNSRCTGPLPDSICGNRSTMGQLGPSVSPRSRRRADSGPTPYQGSRNAFTGRRIRR